jgi:hypothetical protein
MNIDVLAMQVVITGLDEKSFFPQTGQPNFGVSLILHEEDNYDDIKCRIRRIDPMWSNAFFLALQ